MIYNEKLSILLQGPRHLLGAHHFVVLQSLKNAKAYIFLAVLEGLHRLNGQELSGYELQKQDRPFPSFFPHRSDSSEAEQTAIVRQELHETLLKLNDGHGYF